MDHLGLSRDAISDIVHSRIEEAREESRKEGVSNDQALAQLLGGIVVGLVEVIEANNAKVLDDVKRLIGKDK